MRIFKGDQPHFILQLSWFFHGLVSVPKEVSGKGFDQNWAISGRSAGFFSNKWVSFEWDSWTYDIGLSTSYHVPENQTNDMCQTCDCISSSWGATGSEYEANSCFLKHFCFMGTEWSEPTAVPSDSCSHLRRHWKEPHELPFLEVEPRTAGQMLRQRARSLTVIQNGWYCWFGLIILIIIL